MKLRALAAIAAATIALAGCDGGPSGGSSTGGGQPSASSSVSSSLAAWMEVVSCLRAHGHPGYPDPVEDGQGGWKLPQSAGNIDIPAPCDDLVRQARQQTLQLEEVPSAEDMAKLRQYAKCIREHGVPNFPDPDSEGRFGNGPETETLRKAVEACKHYRPARPPKGES